MANPFTLLGRVGADPMRIPTAASMQSGIDDRFDRVLREATAAAEPAAAPAAPTASEASTETEPTDAPRTEPESEREVADEAPAAERETATVATDRFDAALTVDVTDNTHRGEPVRQETAGKGADSPRISSADAGPSPDGARSGAMAKATPVPVAVAMAGTTPANTAMPNSEQGLRGIGATAATGAAAAVRTPRAQAGYATRSAAQAQLVEHARDSVFKQILLKLSPEGGEMRLRLDPPQLGELDLRLTMGEGNRLSLAIAAERGDVQQLLQRHLDELKQVLQANGLEVADAQVQTQSQFARERDAGHAGQGAAQHEDPAEAAASAPLQRGYITAEGLDFWA